MRRWIAAGAALLSVMVVFGGGAATTALGRDRPAGAIDDQRQRNAASEPQSWLVKGGTFDGQYFSKLDQINIRTVKDLGPAWSFEFDTNRGQESEPIVVDGVMYVTTAWSKVYALDAKTGRQLWFYDPKVTGHDGMKACCDVVNRGAAVYKGRVFVGAIDGRLIALDARTGKVAWSTQTTDPTKMYSITGVPLVVKNKVIIGNGGADFGVRGYVSAYDVDTGKMVWRFYTAPGDPKNGPDHAASDNIMETLVRPTWDGDYYKYGAGGTAWNAISYDQDLDQIYIGTGNGSPWNYQVRSNRRGDNLFLCAIVALNPDTGKYIWHYQENPAEAWDYNSVQPIMLATLKIDGAPRKVLMHAPKNGFFYVIDRLTGKLISATPAVNGITWASRIDISTGRPVDAPNSRYENGPFALSPGPPGAHSFSPMAYNPATGLVYLPVSENGVTMDGVKKFEPEDDGPSNSGATSKPMAMTAKKYFIAFDPMSKQIAWRHDTPGGGFLTTAGGLLFQVRGVVLGEFVAYRASDGKELWSYQIPSAAMPAPVTYSIDGQQYIAIVTGAGGPSLITGSVSEAYGRIPGRVLVFKLGGKAILPPDPDPPPPPNPAADTWTPQEVAQGGALFGRYCSRCHGAGAVSANVVPDLRRSGFLPDKAAWRSVVHDGALQSQGMIAWNKLLTAEQIDTIRGYISSRAEELRKAGDPQPPRRERPARATVAAE